MTYRTFTLLYVAMFALWIWSFRSAHACDGDAPFSPPFPPIHAPGF